MVICGLVMILWSQPHKEEWEHSTYEIHTLSNSHCQLRIWNAYMFYTLVYEKTCQIYQFTYKRSFISPARWGFSCFSSYSKKKPQKTLIYPDHNKKEDNVFLDFVTLHDSTRTGVIQRYCNWLLISASCSLTVHSLCSCGWKLIPCWFEVHVLVDPIQLYF